MFFQFQWLKEAQDVDLWPPMVLFNHVDDFSSSAVIKSTIQSTTTVVQRLLQLVSLAVLGALGKNYHLIEMR